jgi:lysophospholipase L1-like esterase
MRRTVGFLSLLTLALLTGVHAEEPRAAGGLLLKKGQRVAVVGDSITEQKLYSRYLELYLTACLRELDLRVVQLGWSGETAPGFAGRMNNDLLPWKPDVVTTCYGMNDGGYRTYDDAIGKRYRDAMADIVGRLKKTGSTVVVGSPGAVDFTFFKNPNLPPAVYNDNLAHLRDVARQLAEQEKMPFADVHGSMISAMEKAKPVLGDGYDVCGKDGFHPGPNGHLLMAYAFLKALGIEGEIGTITVDLKGAASASEGHKVVLSEAGKVELESARWPFCFSGDEKSSGGTRSILPFTSFNQDLNRLTLVVKNLDAEKAKVTWGAASKTFAKAELEKGVNLAAEFADTPFSEPFRKLEGLIAAKQNFETLMIKQTINSFPRLVDATGKDAEVAATVDTLRKQLIEVQERMGANARAAVVPVKHAIQIAPEK